MNKSTSHTSLKTAFRTCKKTPNDCSSIKNLLINGNFDNRQETINLIRTYTEEKNPFPITRKDMSLMLLNNEYFYSSITPSETRELLDMISGHASKMQDISNSSIAHTLKRPFIYRSDVKRITTDLGRSYDIPDLGLKSWPSVTGVYSSVHPFDPTLWINKLQRDNPTWSADDIEEEMERVRITAATRGSMMHEAIETYLKDRINFNILQCELLGRPYFKNIYDYLRYEIDEVVAIEPLAYIDVSKEFGINDAGCMGYIDLIGTHNGKNIIYDWKTSDKPKQAQYIDSYLIQVSAYAAMTYYTYGIKIDEARIVIAIKGKDKPQVFTLDRDEIKVYLNKFLNNLKKYKLMKEAEV